MGVASGYKEVYRFPITYPYILLLYISVLFCSSIPTFVHFYKCFSLMFQYFFYVLSNPPQYKHTYGQLWASHLSHMKAAHNALYKKHTQTNASYPAMDISCIPSMYTFRAK